MAQKAKRELEPGEREMTLPDGRVAIIHPDRLPVIVEPDGTERTTLNFWELGWNLL